MIFPFVPVLRGILSFSQVPITWVLVALNLVVFYVTLPSYVESQAELEKALGNETFILTQGKLYSQFVQGNKGHYSPTLIELSNRVRSHDIEKLQLLGGLALRSPEFMEGGNLYSYSGDEVAIGWWKEKFNELKDIQAQHPTYVFGLNYEDLSFSKWISYQFSHSGLFHLAFNMLFLLIFGSMIEPIVGGLAVLVLYVGSGMVAAGAFLLFNGISAIPLVGASGAVSGLIGFCCLMFWNRPVRFFAFLPQRDYFGFVYLPAWIIIVTWALIDLAGYFSHLNEFGGVAHTAHLGGEAAGLLVGLTFALLRRRHPQGMIPHDKAPESHPAGTRVA